MQDGVDVVLNTLTSSGMVAASLAALTPGAHFVEISKRDIWSAPRMVQGEKTCSRCECDLCTLQYSSPRHILPSCVKGSAYKA